MRQHTARHRLTLTPPLARRIVADIVGAAAATVDREYTLANHWELISLCWPRERRTIMREVLYRRYSWF